MTSQAITKMILSPYIGKIPVSSDTFLSLCSDILKLLNSKNKSLISYSRPIAMKKYSYNACNTVILNVIYLQNYYTIDALQKSLQLIYSGRSNPHDRSNLFTIVGIKVDESRSSHTDFYIESIRETVLTDSITEIQNLKPQLITTFLTL